ncbi:MAG: hypothetical protein ACYC61_17520 [Isosphaeraceae bacterium]
MGQKHAASPSTSVAFDTSVKARVIRNLTMTPAADELLANLADRSGLSEGDVLRLALAMFKTAVDAREQGKHVGVASSPEVLDLELVGF